MPKTDAEWLTESKDWPHIFKLKVMILGELALGENVIKISKASKEEDVIIRHLELMNKSIITTNELFNKTYRR